MPKLVNRLWSAFPFNPAALIIFSSLIYLCALRAGPSWSVATNFHWYVTPDQASVVKLGILAMLAGLILAHLVTLNTDHQPNFDLSKIVNKGRLLCYTAICAYLVWFAVSSDEWLHPNTYGHVSTVPGLTTLTQVLPLGLGCLYLGHKFGLGLPHDKWIFVGTLVLTLERVFVNHERLALAETYFPIIVIYLALSPQPRGLRKLRRLMILPGLAFGASILFALLEYFRSWSYYRSYYSGSYATFAAQRLETYYISALNNGAIYDTYSKSSRLAFKQLLDFVWQFPVIGQQLAERLSPNIDFNWSLLLKSALRTDEFNNPSALLPLASEATRIGMFIVLCTLTYVMSRLHSRMRNGDAMAMLIYASLALGLFELPLIFWFTLGKTLPVHMALIWLSRSQKKYASSQGGTSLNDLIAMPSQSTKASLA